MKTHVIAVVGTKKSGKTTTIENLIREFTNRGYKVAAIKHISEPNHTIDKPGKDTWRYVQAGAKIVVSAASHEIATIEKTSLEMTTFEALVKRCKGSDLVFVEGLKSLVAQRKSISKIVVAKSEREVLDALKKYTNIIAFSGPYCSSDLNLEASYADSVTSVQELADIVENKMAE